MSHGLRRSANLECARSTRLESSAAHNGKIRQGKQRGAKRERLAATKTHASWVVKLTVAFAAWVPSSVTEEGETVHVAACGAPEQFQTPFDESTRRSAETVEFCIFPDAMVVLGWPTETV